MRRNGVCENGVGSVCLGLKNELTPIFPAPLSSVVCEMNLAKVARIIGTETLCIGSWKDDAFNFFQDELDMAHDPPLAFHVVVTGVVFRQSRIEPFQKPEEREIDERDHFGEQLRERVVISEHT
jgi:hypothetical protein